MHGTIPGVVRTLGPADYPQWADGRIMTPDHPVMERGRIERRERVRIPLGSTGTSLEKCESLKKLLMVFFDLCEGTPSYVLCT